MSNHSTAQIQSVKNSMEMLAACDMNVKAEGECMNHVRSSHDSVASSLQGKGMRQHAVNASMMH